jgi:hypothetical protein
MSYDVFAYDDVWNLHPILDPSDRKHLKRSCNDVLRETEFMRYGQTGRKTRSP